ncbi:MAG TPA: polymer-forming cytoskeletal protein, partial [Firmicutes bacterium]|nr:polymer-forming cytoskeletal protein [Bacillota bacterium]
MFKGSKKESPPDKVITLIGPGTYFNGILKAKGLVRIDGIAEGELETDGDVIVGENGRAMLEVKARNVAIAGYFKGCLNLAGKVEIRSTGTVTGSIKVSGLVIDEGAHFAGSCEMNDLSLENNKVPQ